MTIQHRFRNLAAAAGCLAFLSVPVCASAQEEQGGEQKKVQEEVAAKDVQGSPRREAPAMPSLQRVIDIWGFPMKELGEGYVECNGWIGRQEFGTVMAFWKAESRTSAWFGLMNYPEDLSDLSLRFKYVRSSATRFEVDCERRRIRAVERVHTAAPFLKGELFDRRMLMRKWISIFDGRIDPQASSQIEDRESEIFERSFALACSLPKAPE